MALDSILSTPVTPRPPKGATSPTTGSSSGGDSSSTSTSSTSGSGSAHAAGNSSGSSSGSAAKSSGKSNTTSHGAKSSSQAQSASSGAKAQQGSATNQSQAAAGASNAAAQSKNPGPSFIQALAQTQADAQDSAATTAAAAPQEVTGGKPKGAKDDHADTNGTALGFLSQSLAAAMAGLQPTNPGQNLTPNTTTDDDSTDAVSLAGGGSSTIQSVVANIAQGTAEELAHSATTAADRKADPSSSSAAPVIDNTAAAANAFQAHMASRAQSTANADALSNKVNTPVGDAGFADDVGGKITWMANQGVQSASLQLTPEHLGPVEVHISMQDGSASVSFNAAHADTRAALEQTLPRLREMFSTQGLTLTDASVSQQSPRGQPQRQAVSAIGAIGGVSGDDPISSVTTVTRAQLGLVDTYA